MTPDPLPSAGMPNGSLGSVAAPPTVIVTIAGETFSAARVIAEVSSIDDRHRLVGLLAPGRRGACRDLPIEGARGGEDRVRPERADDGRAQGCSDDDADEAAAPPRRGRGGRGSRLRPRTSCGVSAARRSRRRPRRRPRPTRGDARRPASRRAGFGFDRRLGTSTGGPAASTGGPAWMTASTGVAGAWAGTRGSGAGPTGRPARRDRPLGHVAGRVEGFGHQSCCSGRDEGSRAWQANRCRGYCRASGLRRRRRHGEEFVTSRRRSAAAPPSGDRGRAITSACFGSRGRITTTVVPVPTPALHGDAAAVHVHDRLHDREPEAAARPARLVGPRAAVEALEDVGDLAGVDPDARVAHLEPGAVAMRLHRHHHESAARRELDRVAQQVGHHLADPLRVVAHADRGRRAGAAPSSRPGAVPPGRPARTRTPPSSGGRPAAGRGAGARTPASRAPAGCGPASPGGRAAGGSSPGTPRASPGRSPAGPCSSSVFMRQGRERGPQLVGDVGQEVAAPVAVAPDQRDRLLEAIGHHVELAGQLGDLRVRALQLRRRDAAGEVARRRGAGWPRPGGAAGA